MNQAFIESSGEVGKQNNSTSFFGVLKDDTESKIKEQFSKMNLSEKEKFFEKMQEFDGGQHVKWEDLMQVSQNKQEEKPSMNFDLEVKEDFKLLMKDNNFEE